MAVVSELIRNEKDGTISFGDFSLTEKKKVCDFKHDGDLYKVKSFNEITKLERNDMFVYESVPGTTVEHLASSEKGITFSVEGSEDAQITLELEPETEYKIQLNHQDAGIMKTNLGGKLSLSVELEAGSCVPVSVMKA